LYADIEGPLLGRLNIVNYQWEVKEFKDQESNTIFSRIDALEKSFKTHVDWFYC